MSACVMSCCRRLWSHRAGKGLLVWSCELVAAGCAVVSSVCGGVGVLVGSSFHSHGS